MEYLCEQLVVSLTDPGKPDTFIADVFQPREQILRFSEAWSTEVGEKMRQAMKRQNCVLA
eukprot:2423717-Karenia_brevis.AAC.1